MEWLVSIVLLIISIIALIFEGPVFFLFLIPAILFSPIILDLLYDKGIYITNTVKWVFIFIFCIIGAFIIANKEIAEYQNIDIINPMDGLVLNEKEIITLDEEERPDIIDENKEIPPEEEQLVIEEVNYVVEYYYDGNLITSATDNLIGNNGDTIKDYKDKSLDKYKLLKTENFPLKLSPAKKDLTIRVHYTSIEETATETIKGNTTYTIRYYYDGILDSSKTKYLQGNIDDIITTYPKESKEGCVVNKTKNIPMKLTDTPELNDIRIYYGPGKATIMNEVGLVDGFAPVVLLKTENPETHEIIEQYECPYCGSIYNKDLLEQLSEKTFKCPFCENEVLYDDEGKMYDADGNELEETIDNPEQQKIAEKYALDNENKKIHNPLCYYVRKIPTEQFSGTNVPLEELKNQGYEICTKCNPK